MAVWEEIRHQVAISGRITDTISGKGLTGVRVSITNGPAAYLDWIAVQSGLSGGSWDSLTKRPDRVMTGNDGHFHFMDLPDGIYTVEAGYPSGSRRYGKASRIVTVSRITGGKIVMAVSDMALPVTTVKGNVTRQGSATPVFMAEIRVVGSGELTYTDDTGSYRLTGIESSPAASRVLKIVAPGYQDKTVSVMVPAPGDEVVLDVQLVKV